MESTIIAKHKDESDEITAFVFLNLYDFFVNKANNGFVGTSRSGWSYTGKSRSSSSLTVSLVTCSQSTKWLLFPFAAKFWEGDDSLRVQFEKLAQQ